MHNYIVHYKLTSFQLMLSLLLSLPWHQPVSVSVCLSNLSCECVFFFLDQACLISLSGSLSVVLCVSVSVYLSPPQCFWYHIPSCSRLRGRCRMCASWVYYSSSSLVSYLIHPINIHLLLLLSLSFSLSLSLSLSFSLSRSFSLSISLFLSLSL